MAKKEITEVGYTKRVFVAQFKLTNLKTYVNVRLAERGEAHVVAATRTKMSKAYWSKLVNANQLSETDFKRIARGLAVTVNQLKQGCGAT